MTWVRRAGWGMIGAGLLILAFLAYQLFVTNLLTARSQAALTDELSARLTTTTTVETTTSTTGPTTTTTAPTTTTTADLPPPPLLTEASPELGAALARILIPSAGVDAVVVEGVRRNDLKKGPGHMEHTPLPGQPGNSVISGHRTTYGAPFGDLDLVQPGDEIVVETAIGRHTYQVRESIVVEPTDVWVTDPRPGAWLTLTTCHPKFSARQRLIVFAELVEGPNLEAIAGTA